jgi:hypothetical protein
VNRSSFLTVRNPAVPGRIGAVHGVMICFRSYRTDVPALQAGLTFWPQTQAVGHSFLHNVAGCVLQGLARRSELCAQAGISRPGAGQNNFGRADTTPQEACRARFPEYTPAVSGLPSAAGFALGTATTVRAAQGLGAT